MRKRIVCVAPEDDEHGRYLENICDQIGIAFSFLDIGKANARSEVHVPLNGEYCALHNVVLSPDTVIWWRRPLAPNIDSRITDSRLRKFASYQWDLAVRSALVLSECAIVNDPTNERLSQSKPLQIRKAREVGFRIPETIVTNSPEKAEKFISYLKSSGKRCVFKSLFPVRFHFGETRVINSIEGLEEELKLAPVIFQECIEKGIDTRITYFGGQVYGTRIVVTHDDLIDWRLDPAHRYEPIEVDPNIQDTGFRLLAELGLRTGSFDFRIDPSGELFFFEVNPSGQFLYLSRFGFPRIGEEFANFLLSC